MPFLFLIFGLTSVAIGVLFLGSIVLGLSLQRTKRFKTLGVFVLLMPTLAAIGAGWSSWGLAFWADSMSKSATTPESWQRWQVLAFWAWATGLGVGATLGATLGGLLGLLIIKRRRTRLAQSAV
jgi:hypothetical protein